MGLPRIGVRRLMVYLIAAAALSLLIAAQVFVVGQGGTYSGGLLPLKHLYDLAVALGLLALCAALGRAVLRRARLDFDEPVASLSFSTAAGAGVLAMLLLVLGWMHGFQRITVALLLVLTAILVRSELKAVPRLAVRAVRDVTGGAADPVTRAVSLTALALTAVFLLVLALAPPVDWDALMYHLQVPRQLLEHGRIYLPEDNLHVSRVGLIHMLYVPLLAAGSSPGPAVLSALMALLLALTVFSLARRFFDLYSARISLALIWGTTTILLVAITPRVDVSLTVYLLLAHYALLLALESEQASRFLYLAGALLGLAVGIKYHAIAYAVALAPLVIGVVLSRRELRRVSLRSLFVFGALVAVFAAPWLAKNWFLLGAPLYPFFSQPQLPPWLASYLGSPGMPTGFDMRAFQLIWEARAAFNIEDAFLAPGRLSIESEGSAYYTNPALVLLPLCLMFVRNRRLNWLLVPAIGYLLLTLLPFPRTNLRYLIPALVPLTIAVAFAATSIIRRFFEPSGRPVLALLVALALFPSARTMVERLQGTAALEHLAGITSQEDYLATHVLSEVRNLTRVDRFIDDQVPAGSRILMLFEARGYYLRPELIQDNKATNWALLASSLKPGDCLERLGISHVLIGVGAVSYYLSGGVEPEVLRWDELRSFADRCLTPIYQGPAFVLFSTR